MADYESDGGVLKMLCALVWCLTMLSCSARGAENCVDYCWCLELEGSLVCGRGGGLRLPFALASLSRGEWCRLRQSKGKRSILILQTRVSLHHVRSAVRNAREFVAEMR